MKISEFNYDFFVNYLSQKFSVSQESITRETHFSQFGLDSISIYRLLEDVEKQYNVRLEPEDLFNIDEVGKLYDFIREKLSLLG